MRLSFRNIAAFIWAEILFLTGIVHRSVKKKIKEKIIFSVYTHNPDKLLFESIILWLKKHGFNFISVKELASFMDDPFSFPTGTVLVTVDDGWRDNLKNIVTVAEKHFIPVTIFVSTEPVIEGSGYWWSYISFAHKNGMIDCTVEDLKKMTNDERLHILKKVKSDLELSREAFTIEEINTICKSDFVSIESHTVNHPILTECTDHDAWEEIYHSKKILQRWTDKPVIAFAYPNGNYSEREKTFLKDAGYQLAFTTSNSFITPENIKNNFQLPRIDIMESVSFAENICRITGVWFEYNKPFRFLFKRKELYRVN